MYMNLVAMLNILGNVHLIKLGSHLLIGEKLWSCAMLTLAVGQMILVVPASQNTKYRTLFSRNIKLFIAYETRYPCPVSFPWTTAHAVKNTT